MEGEIVDRLYAVFLDGHGAGHAHPSVGALAGDADRLVGRYLRKARHVGDVGRSVVLAGWRPTGDDLTDSEETILVIVGACEQHKGCAPTILQRLELAELRVGLWHSQSLPFHAVAADVKWIVVTDSSW